MNVENKLIEMDEQTHISLREERRRTGRYVAVALAICITLLGLYQAIVQHTPVVAGLFAPAIIMFLYVFWVLYTASKTKHPQEFADADAGEEQGGEDCNNFDASLGRSMSANQLNDVVSTIPKNVTSVATVAPKDINIQVAIKEDNILAERSTKNKLNRTYSIA